MTKLLFARYLIVGGASYVIEMATLYGLGHFFGFSPLLAVAISFWIGFIVAFVLQKVITFQNRDRRASAIASQIAVYSLLVAWNYIFTLLLVTLFEHITPVMVIRTIVIIITTIWNFAIYGKMFKRTENKNDQSQLG